MELNTTIDFPIDQLFYPKNVEFERQSGTF